LRVLFTCFAWPSHYFPMVPVAWALRAAGHEVRMTSQPALLATMRESGLPGTPVGTDIDVTVPFRGTRNAAVARNEATPNRTARLSDRLTADPDRPHLVRGLDLVRRLEDQMHARRPTGDGPGRAPLFATVAEAMVDDLLALARSWRPDVVVHDALSYAGPLVAAVMGIPAVRNLFGPDVTYLMTAGDAQRMQGLLGRFGLAEVDLLGTATIDPCPPDLQLPNTITPTQRLPIRYTPYPGLTEIPPWLSHLPDRPRICLTWGTSIHRLLGNRAFLPPEILHSASKLATEHNAELLLAITANQRHLLPDLPDHIRIAESVPLDALLPTCQALIHQGGAGTMLTGLRHGLPQLILPHILDEAVNAYQLTTTGAGLTHAATELSTTDILTAGHELLTNPTHRTAAQHLQHHINQQPTPAQLTHQLTTLIS
jgi:UDP:flavonoid glycosyltransferase YjiC (YdhE family)